MNERHPPPPPSGSDRVASVLIPASLLTSRKVPDPHSPRPAIATPMTPHSGLNSSVLQPRSPPPLGGLSSPAPPKAGFYFLPDPNLPSVLTHLFTVRVPLPGCHPVRPEASAVPARKVGVPQKRMWEGEEG